MFKFHRACGVLYLLIGAAPLAAQGLAASADDAAKRIMLNHRGTVYVATVDKGAVIIRIGTQSHPLRISAAEGRARATEFLEARYMSGEASPNDAEQKVAQAVYAIGYGSAAPSAESRRGKAAASGGAPPVLDAQAKLTLSARDDQPLVFLTYELSNQGDPFLAYILPWINSSLEGYVIPGADGAQSRRFQGKYADVAAQGGLAWILIHRPDGQNLGLTFPDPSTVYVGEHSTQEHGAGSIYLNALPRYQELAKGASITLRLGLMPAATVDALSSAAAAK